MLWIHVPKTIFISLLSYFISFHLHACLHFIGLGWKGYFWGHLRSQGDYLNGVMYWPNQVRSSTNTATRPAAIQCWFNCYSADVCVFLADQWCYLLWVSVADYFKKADCVWRHDGWEKHAKKSGLNTVNHREHKIFQHQWFECNAHL